MQDIDAGMQRMEILEVLPLLYLIMSLPIQASTLILTMYFCKFDMILVVAQNTNCNIR